MGFNNKDIIILGCQRSGKTTLSNILSTKDNYSIFSVDSLIQAFDIALPQSNITRKMKIVEKTKILTPFIGIYMKKFKNDYPNQKCILESCQLLPKDIMAEESLKNAQMVCLGYPNASEEEIFHNIRKNDKFANSPYTYNMNDEQLKCSIPFWIKYSKFLQKESKELRIPFYETNIKRYETLSTIADNLLCMCYDNIEH